jgi:hypothetical protein
MLSLLNLALKKILKLIFLSSLRFLDIWMIVVFIYPFIIILIHTALHVLRSKRSPWTKHLAKWILRSVASS